jgi:hypothetical protein
MLGRETDDLAPVLREELIQCPDIWTHPPGSLLGKESSKTLLVIACISSLEPWGLWRTFCDVRTIMI